MIRSTALAALLALALAAPVHTEERPVGRPGSCTLVVRVMDRGGGAVAGAAVRLGWNREGVTDATGRVSFGKLDPVTQRIEVDAAGYGLATRSRGMDLDGHAEVTVRLEAGPPLVGTIRAADTGTPIVGASVRIHRARMEPHITGIPVPWEIGSLQATTTTDGEGAFRLPHVPGEDLIAIADAPGRARVWKLLRRRTQGEVTLFEGPDLDGPIPDAPLEIPLVAGATAVGHVFDAEGRAVEGAYVLALPSDLSRSSGRLRDAGDDAAGGWTRSFGGLPERLGPLYLRDFWTARIVRSGPDGRFELTGLCAGERYAVWAEVAGGGRSEDVPCRPLGAQTPPSLALSLTESPARRPPSPYRRPPTTWTELAGVVVDEQGESIAGAVLEEPVRTVTDAAGRFRLPFVDERGVRLRVTAPGRRDFAEFVRASDGDLRIVMEPLATLRLTLVVPEGARAPERITARARGPDPEDLTRSYRAPLWQPSWPDPAAESATFERALRGTVDQLRIRAAGFLPAEVALTLDPGASTARRVTLEPGRTWTGRLLDAAGRPLANRVVEGWADGVRQSSVTDASGAFRVQGMPLRIERFAWIETAGFERIDVAAHVDRMPRDIRLTPLATVTVRVVDADGLPVARAFVYVGDKDHHVGHYRATPQDGVVTVETRAGPTDLWVGPAGDRDREREQRLPVFTLVTGEHRRFEITVPR